VSLWTAKYKAEIQGQEREGPRWNKVIQTEIRVLSALFTFSYAKVPGGGRVGLSSTELKMGATVSLCGKTLSPSGSYPPLPPDTTLAPHGAATLALLCPTPPPVAVPLLALHLLLLHPNLCTQPLPPHSVSGLMEASGALSLDTESSAHPAAPLCWSTVCSVSLHADPAWKCLIHSAVHLHWR
jgi:hypothetical protein